jgi:predicted ATPase
LSATALVATLAVINPCPALGAERENDVAVVDVFPRAAFAGSAVALEIEASAATRKMLTTLEPADVTVLIDGRRAPILSYKYPRVRVEVPPKTTEQPVVELRIGDRVSEPFSGLRLMPPLVSVIPSKATPGAPVSIVTGWQLPVDIRDRVSVLFDKQPVKIEEFGKGEITVLVPEIDPGPVRIGYTIKGVEGSSGALSFEVLAEAAGMQSVLGERWWQIALVVVIVAIALVLLGPLRRLFAALLAVPPVEDAADEEPPTWRKVTGSIAAVLDRRVDADEPRIVVEKVHIENLKNIKNLYLDFTEGSNLEGNWTCIAGINGSGKSTILQAICILLLGEKLAAELGSERLRRMLRREGDETHDVRLEAWVRRGQSEPIRLLIPINRKGIDEGTLRSDPDYAEMRAMWEYLERTAFVSYGATRNLSETEDTRYDYVAEQVRRQMTLFDPLTRIVGIDALLKGGPQNRQKLQTLFNLLRAVVDEDGFSVSYHKPGDRLVFRQTGANVDAIDLPDGFRSTVAWLADVCTVWHETGEEQERDTDPSKITGVVLLDEIGLHLHPGLARSIVPQLRKALPGVQFIVTTHSPLVLSSFDRAELIVLESDPEGKVGVRELDRQVFGFTMDEVYRWLMRTPPQSSVLESMAKEGTDPNFATYLYQTEATDETDAKELVDDMMTLLKELKDDRKKK